MSIYLSVKTIGVEAFGSARLKTICLPSVTRIERYAFRFCSNLENKLYHIMMTRSYSYVALADEASLWYDLTRIQTLLSFL